MMKSLDRRGFTLIEVLVASTLTAVVLGAIYGAFFTSHRALQALDGTMVRLHEARTALDIIGREVESALFSKSKDYTVFIVKDIDAYGAQTSSLTLTTMNSLMPGLALVKYSVREEEGGASLTLIKELSSPYSKGAAGGSAEVVEDIESFTVQAKDNGRWLKTWDGRAAGGVGMPEALRITITVPAGERTVTLTRTARPMTGSTP